MFLRQLEYLTALAREQHFGRAAAACWVSQPTLSDGIRKLEAEFGVSVVRRGHRFEGFTPEGERLLAWARRLLADRDQLVAEFGRSSHQGLTGRLRLGAVPASLPPVSLLTGPFCERHPETSLTVLSLTSAEIHRRLIDFELDAGLTYLTGEPLTGFRAMPLYHERYVLLTSQGGEFADRTEVGWAEVAELPLCLLTPDMQHRRILDDLFLQAGVTVTPRMETNSVSTLCSHVRSGNWASVIPQAWLGLLGVPPGTRVLPLVEPTATSTVGLLVLDRDPQPLVTSALIRVAERLDLQRSIDALVPVESTDQSGPPAPRSEPTSPHDRPHPADQER
ncbi:LysR family transcriptional regulator [Micromonospora sp. HM5-17]|jgi:DNA-binding transcriptional LysR family regulator|uniref:LysR family transcriptional regulator n=1 Tax=Micromonospora sp. HM5-17 TaxID=2487710 RepID=UPI000F475568|nr:LysR family transcriptional regulator [Micromonospora sp. HM5-17]ROT33068.1 LysR family transcriptional regulator [Micromonospora sp. HM5-17]